MTKVISVENLSKTYRLGQIGTGTLTNDLQVWWAKVRGNPNPMLRVGDTDHGNRAGEIIWALKDVNFSVEQGDVLGIIGRNGAGKSTLLKILSRVTAPTSGHAHVKGRIASLLEVGTGFHPDLTGRENTYLNGAILGMRRDEVRRKFDEIVDFSGVELFIDTPVKRYSSGMFVRLAFAVAAHLDPEILIVDEVLAVGDVEFQTKCIGKMGEVAKGGRTVLFVSHNMVSIRSLCSRGILLGYGMVLYAGDINNTIDVYFQGLEKKIDNFQRIVTPKICIEKIVLTDNCGNSLDYIDSDTSFNINLYYKIAQEGFYGLTLSLIKQGTFIFQSINNQNASDEEIKKTGNYISICQIPGKFLNNGKYSITINIHERNYTNSIDYNEIFSFFINDGISVRKNYFGGYLGGIRPLLRWETRKLAGRKLDID